MALFRQWENADPTYLHILRFVRICAEYPDEMHITRPGRDGVGVNSAEANKMDVTADGSSEDATVEVGRVGSSMLAMDEIPQG